MPEPTEQNSTQPEVEKQVENETLENEDTQTDEGTNGSQPESTDVEKKEESPYEKQLKELEAEKEKLEAEKKKQDEIIEHKNRAIEALKKEKKETPKADDDLEERLFNRFKAEQQQEIFNNKLQTLTADEAERKVIAHHYNNSIVKTGDLEKDLRAAVALADADVVWERRQNQAMEEGREDFLTSFAGQAPRGNVKNVMQSAAQAEAAKIVGAVNPKAVEHLKKYV